MTSEQLDLLEERIDSKITELANQDDKFVFEIKRKTAELREKLHASLCIANASNLF